MTTRCPAEPTQIRCWADCSSLVAKGRATGRRVHRELRRPYPSLRYSDAPTRRSGCLPVFPNLLAFARTRTRLPSFEPTFEIMFVGLRRPRAALAWAGLMLAHASATTWCKRNDRLEPFDDLQLDHGRQISGAGEARSALRRLGKGRNRGVGERTDNRVPQARRAARCSIKNCFRHSDARGESQRFMRYLRLAKVSGF